MRLGEAKGRWCQPLGHPVFRRHSGKKVLTGVLVSTIPANSTIWCRGRRGAQADSPDPWVLCPGLGGAVVPCPLDSALLGSQEISEPHTGPMCLPGPPAHTLLWGTPHHRSGRHVGATGHCRESRTDVWPSSITMGVGEAGSLALSLSGSSLMSSSGVRHQLQLVCPQKGTGRAAPSSPEACSEEPW